MAFRRVNECKEVSLQYSSNGIATFEFWTDIAAGPTVPGTLANALTTPVTLPSTTAVGKRQTATIPLDGIRATEFQAKVIPGVTTQFELYSMVVYLRPIGVYLNGANPEGAEIWSTVPIAPGV